MMGHRMSSLAIAEKCAKAPKLSSLGAGGAAAQSTCFHALCADVPGAKDMLTRLSEDQVAELMEWQKPTDASLKVGEETIILRYVDAEKEFEVALKADGTYCEASDPECVTVGHPDFAWLVVTGGLRIAVIGDLKRSEYTTKDGPRALQLLAYLVAFADKHGADMGFCGLWHLQEAEWSFGEMIDLGMFSDARAALVDRITAAATHVDGDYSRGSHCDGCYGRLQCPAYLMPSELSETALAPLTTGERMTSAQARELLELAGRQEATAAKIKAEIKAQVYRGLRILDEDGKKVYAPCPTKGRAGFDAKGLAVKHPDIAAEFATAGKPFDTFRWVNQ